MKGRESSRELANKPAGSKKDSIVMRILYLSLGGTAFKSRLKLLSSMTYKVPSTTKNPSSGQASISLNCQPENVITRTNGERGSKLATPKRCTKRLYKK